MSYITTLEFPDDDYNAHRIIKENKKNRELYKLKFSRHRKY